jgi:hypothetical protein
VVYVVRLGPIETVEGAEQSIYLPFADGQALEPAWAKRDADGLRRVAKKHGGGHELQCEPQLRAAGKKLGFTSKAMPPWVREGRAFLAYGMGLGTYAEHLAHGVSIPTLLSASGRFMEAEPWQWWTDADALEVAVMGSARMSYEGCIMGAAGETCGLALYERAGAVKRIAELVDAGDYEAAKQEPFLSMTIRFEPAWAAEAVDEAYGTLGLPIPMKMIDGQMGTLDALSIATLSGALEAIAMLRPGNLLETAEVELDGARIRVSVDAPEPRAG